MIPSRGKIGVRRIRLKRRFRSELGTGTERLETPTGLSEARGQLEGRLVAGPGSSRSSLFAVAVGQTREHPRLRPETPQMHLERVAGLRIPAQPGEGFAREGLRPGRHRLSVGGLDGHRAVFQAESGIAGLQAGRSQPDPDLRLVGSRQGPFVVPPGLLDAAAPERQVAQVKRSTPVTRLGLLDGSEELAGRGVRVNAVAPGPVDTDLFRAGKNEEAIKRSAAMSPFNRVGQPQEVADVVSFLASDKASWVHGQIVQPNGGLV